MRSTLKWAAFLAVLITTAGWAGEAKYSIKTVDKSAPPKELDESIRKLLNDHSIKLLDPNGKTIGELWFRKVVPVDATAEQLKNGLTYREVKESTILAAVRFEQDWSDYRKQKVKPGVYTLRLGFQPMDGDHMGTAPHNEFCLLLSADKDTKTDLIDTKALQKLSTDSIGTTHPGVMLLFPYNNPKDAAKLVSKSNDHWVLNVKENVSVGGKTAEQGLGIGLTVVGHSES
jgi:hypothetical protein